MNQTQNNWKSKTMLFLASQCITLFGSMIVQMSIIWYVTLKTSSGGWVAAFTICSYLPQFLISFFAGVWADRYSHKKLIILADSVIAVAALILFLAIPMISSDSILSNIEDTTLEMGIVTRATEFRQKEQYISLVATGLANDTLLSTKYVYPENTTVMMSELYNEIEDMYLAYGFGELYHISRDFTETLLAASESGGVVVDSNTRLLWNRYKPKSYEISLPEDIFAQNNETKASKEAVADALFSIAGKRINSASLYAKGYTVPECIEYVMGDVVDLSGSDIDLALYFVGEGHPIVAKTGVDKYELVYAYNSTGVYTCDFEQNTNKFYSKSDFNKLISQYDSILISY